MSGPFFDLGVELVFFQHFGPCEQIISACKQRQVFPSCLFHQRHRKAVGPLCGTYSQVVTLYCPKGGRRSEEHMSELQSLIRSSSAAFCLKKTTSSSKSVRIMYSSCQRTTM